MRAFFDPESIAVVGASRKPGKPGHVIVKNLLEGRRSGLLKAEIYPVNPNAEEILGLRCYPSLLDVEGDVELAVFAIPAEAVPSVMEDAAEKGVKGAIIISGGFSEMGRCDLEERVVEIASKAGIRIVGPNCMGIYDPYTGLDTMFIPVSREIGGRSMQVLPRPGRGYIAFVSQSGAFGGAALDYLAGKGLGISKFVNLGNRCDVDEADLLEYLLEDPNTLVVSLYVEGFRDGRKFMKAASEFSLRKPIVAFKAGRTEAGARAALSHTGSLAGSDRICSAAFKQCGVVRAYGMKELFNMAKALLMQPPARGPNVAILTDGGGAGVMAADECEARGLNVVELSEGTLRRFEEMRRTGRIPAFAPYRNPVDLTGSVTDEMLTECLEVLLEDEVVDGVVAIPLHAPPALTDRFVDGIARVSRRFDKPVVVCDIGEGEMATYVRGRFDELGVPAYETPEEAVASLWALYAYGSFLRSRGVFDGYLDEFLSRRRRLFPGV